MGAYHAFFVEGPLAGEQIGLATEKVPELLYFAEMPEGINGVIDRWVVIGTAMDPPEPGEAESWGGNHAIYELDLDASMIRAARGIVIYGYVRPPR